MEAYTLHMEGKTAGDQILQQMLSRNPLFLPLSEIIYLARLYSWEKKPHKSVSTMQLGCSELLGSRWKERTHTNAEDLLRGWLSYTGKSQCHTDRNASTSPGGKSRFKLQTTI